MYCSLNITGDQEVLTSAISGLTNDTQFRSRASDTADFCRVTAPELMAGQNPAVFFFSCFFARLRLDCSLDAARTLAMNQTTTPPPMTTQAPAQAPTQAAVP